MPPPPKPATTFEATYLGFVYIMGKNNAIPSPDKVKDAHKLLKKPKAARNVHPLFARGFDTELRVSVSEEGLLVYLMSGGQRKIVMDHPVHKIAYVVDIGRSVCFVAKRQQRGTDATYKCHGFETASAAKAKELACLIAKNANSLFKKLRRSRWVCKEKGIPMSLADSAQIQKEMSEADLAAERQAAEDEAMEQLRMALGEALAQNEESKRLQKTLRDALLEAEDAALDEDLEIPPSEIADEYIWYDDFSDDFVRMSVNAFTEDEDWEKAYKERYGEYAEIMLDSDMFAVLVPSS
eukprot:m.139021 g.139021  ORF g.139021 m.139021 type:complete len:295 (+) comp16645_c0_seq2:850-1734(+)